MKILLLGEYSNVHNTLARGLRQLGHTVQVVSNGDFWKDYPRDTDLTRRPGRGGGVRYVLRLARLLPAWRGYDVVQLINPMFLELKAERIGPIYRYLRRFNRRVVLGAFGMDYYWVHTCCTAHPLRYSDFNIGSELRADVEALRERADWAGTAKERLNRLIAADCDGIVAGLYEYWVCYRPAFPQKTTFIPFPIELPAEPIAPPTDGRLHLFIGINTERSAYKGTDIMLAAAQAVARQHADRVVLQVARSVPFHTYRQLMDSSHVLLDQLYSYTPAMNALLAMSKGMICVGGGEPEAYELLGERELHPIVNVQPTYDSVFGTLEQLALHPETWAGLSRQSRSYVARHHECTMVARRYEAFYQELLEQPRG